MIKKLCSGLYRFILLKVIGKKRISELVDMYEVSSSIRILENDFGHILSIEKQVPVDLNNEPLPWFTYPAIEYISQLDLKDKTVFEWGSGNSSLYFAKRAKQLISVEDNKEWYERNSEVNLSNQQIFLAEGSEYINYIEKFGCLFDLIIIDGKDRFECAKKAPAFLKEGGFIVLDNSDWYRNTAKYLRNCNFIEVDFHGFGPVNQYNWTTSIFFDRKFNLECMNNVQPLHPIGCLNKECD